MKKIKHRLIGDYPPHLRGLATNSYGGNKLQHERGFKGSKPLPPGPVRVYTEEERKEYERQMRERGDLK